MRLGRAQDVNGKDVEGVSPPSCNIHLLVLLGEYINRNQPLPSSPSFGFPDFFESPIVDPVCEHCPRPKNEAHFFVVAAMHPVSLLLLLAGALSALAGAPFALTGNSLAGPPPIIQTPSLAPQTCQADEVAGKQWNMTWLPAFFSR